MHFLIKVLMPRP